MTRGPGFVIVGAGHNGMTAAAYLARAGHAVQVFERRAVVGGCAVTEEIDSVLAPGCRVSTAAYIASMLRPEVIRDLKLDGYGLRMIACEPGVQAAFEDGEIVSWWTDHGRMRRELERIAPRDVETFFTQERELQRLAGLLEPLFTQPPPDFDARGLARWREARRWWPRVRGLGARDIAGLTAFLGGSLGDYLDRYFSTDKLKRLVLANSLYGKHGGPYQPGTALGLLFHLLSGGEARRPGFQGHVLGGMGEVTAAMRRACEDLGVRFRTDAEVARIDTHAGGVCGVTLASGEFIDARVVISNADPKRTFLRLLDPAALPAEFLAAVRAIRMAGPCAKVNYVLAAEPRVTGMPATHTPLERALFTLVPTLQGAEECYQCARRGDIAEELWVDCVLASNADPGLVTGARHVLTCFVQYLPYAPRTGDWNHHRAALGDRVTAHIERYAPGFADSVIARRVLTPLDLEQTFAITEGNIFHGDLALDQLFHMRPVPGYSHYRTPIRGLYLCGAGTHPGGGVTGAPGYNAAHVVLREYPR